MLLNTKKNSDEGKKGKLMKEERKKEKKEKDKKKTEKCTANKSGKCLE